MSAKKSIMPQGTRLATLLALAITACLMAWRASILLTETPVDRDALSPAQRELTALIEPVFGRDAVRIASHETPGAGQSFLILVNTPETGFDLDSQTLDRVSTILRVGAGYDPARDSLEIRRFAFAPGTATALEQSDIIELGALAGIAILLGFVSLVASQGRQGQPRASEPAQQRPADTFRLPEHPPLRAVPINTPAPERDRLGEARRLAQDNPKETATILRRWMQDEGEPS